MKPSVWPHGRRNSMDGIEPPRIEMFLEALMGSFVEHAVAGATSLARYVYRNARILECSVIRRHDDIRVSFAALLRVTTRDRFVLIQNLHRQEALAPIGGVFKRTDSGRRSLDKLEFRVHALGDGADTIGDLRGFLPRKHLGALLAWYRTGDERESGRECLIRELYEELIEIKATSDLLELARSTQLGFRPVRVVIEGPARVPGQPFDQYRCFEVYEAENETLLRRLAEMADSSPHHVVLATADDILRGRSRSGRVIAHNACYLFSGRRIRPELPLGAGG